MTKYHSIKLGTCTFFNSAIFINKSQFFIFVFVYDEFIFCTTEHTFPGFCKSFAFFILFIDYKISIVWLELSYNSFRTHVQCTNNTWIQTVNVHTANPFMHTLLWVSNICTSGCSACKGVIRLFICMATAYVRSTITFSIRNNFALLMCFIHDCLICNCYCTHCCCK